VKSVRKQGGLSSAKLMRQTPGGAMAPRQSQARCCRYAAPGPEQPHQPEGSSRPRRCSCFTDRYSHVCTSQSSTGAVQALFLPLVAAVFCHARRSHCTLQKGPLPARPQALNKITDLRLSILTSSWFRHAHQRGVTDGAAQLASPDVQLCLNSSRPVCQTQQELTEQAHQPEI